MSAAAPLPPLAPFHITGAEVLHPAGPGAAPLGVSGERIVEGAPGFTQQPTNPFRFKTR